MKFFQFICDDPDGERYVPEQDNIREWVSEMVARGILVHGERLRPVREARLVRVRADEVLVSDGPFAETKEWINGMGILECRDLDEAIEVSSRHPMARFGKIELRAVWPF